MDLQLKDKVIFISASSQGIGKATAEGFLAEGANVVINGRDQGRLNLVQNQLEMVWPGKVKAVAGDISQDQTLDLVKQTVLRAWGRLDILVGNLGNGKSNSRDKNRLNLEEWQRFAAVNLFSAVSLLDQLGGLLKQQRSGSIVLVSSIAGVEASSAPPGYAAAKSGLISLAKNMSSEFAKCGIRINVVAPGHIFFEGGRWEEILKERPEKAMDVERDVALGRFGHPNEIANLILFLCSERASYMTGSTYVVDGGLTRSF